MNDLLAAASLDHNEPFWKHRGTLETFGFLRVTGLFEREEVLRIRRGLESLFTPTADFVEPIYHRKSAQYLRDEDHGESRLARRVRMFYGPPDPWLFQRLAHFRNQLCGVHPDWAFSRPEDGWWTACHFNHYPRGGGFLNAHTDVDYVRDEPMHGYCQPVLYMSQRGEDFATGGGWALTANDAFVDLEEGREIGDVVIVGGRTIHGVRAVDSEAPAVPDALVGRVVAITTPLRVTS